MDPRMIPKGSASEYNYGEQDGKALPNDPGVYFHPKAEKFVETTGVKRPDGSKAYVRGAGKIQADAFVQLGYRQASQEEAAHYRSAQKASAEVQRIKDSRTTFSMSSKGRS